MDSSKAASFVVVGTTTADLFVSGLEHIPEVGADEFTRDNFAFCDEPPALSLGGNGANSAYVLACLGASVALQSAIGTDPFGEIVEGWLMDAGVDTRGLVRRDEAATAVTTVVTDNVPHRLSFHHEGASTTFGIEDAPRGAFEQADVLLVSGYPLLDGWRPDGVAQALHAAHQAGGRTALDVGPALGHPATLAELKPLLPDLDYLICNEHELTVCAGESDIGRAMEEMLEAGAHCLVVKRGGAGALICRAGRPAALQVPGFEVEAHFTVGAGDAFNAGLLFALSKGWAWKRMLRFANATAALVVAGSRGILGAPGVREVEDFIRHKAGTM